MNLSTNIDWLSAPEFYLCIILLIIAGFLSMSKSTDLVDQFSKPAVNAITSLPASYTQWIMNNLNYARLRRKTDMLLFCGIKVYGAIIAGWFVLVLNLDVALSPIAALIIFILPDMVLDKIRKNRQQKIKRALPRVLDLMVLCVDAGLGLQAMMKRVVAFKPKKRGLELREEFELLEQDLALGIGIEQAYRALYERSGVQELRFLASLIVQSSILGLSLAGAIRGQSEHLRSWLLQDIEDEAQKVPLKMLFPIAFGMMPAVMLAIVGPAFVKISVLFKTIHHLKPF